MSGDATSFPNALAVIAFPPWISERSGAECWALLPEIDASRSVFAADGLDLVDVVVEVGGAVERVE